MSVQNINFENAVININLNVPNLAVHDAMADVKKDNNKSLYIQLQKAKARAWAKINFPTMKFKDTEKISMSSQENQEMLEANIQRSTSKELKVESGVGKVTMASKRTKKQFRRVESSDVQYQRARARAWAQREFPDMRF